MPDKVLKMNVEKSSWKSLLRQLPALRNPTVAPLTTDGWVTISILNPIHRARNPFRLQAAARKELSNIR